MAQIKVYALSTTLDRHRDILSDAIHQAIIEALHYPPEKKFQRFIALEKDDFIFPADRSDFYLIIEVSMFSGRSMEAKKALIYALFTSIEQQCGISPQDIEITISETPKENWGIRGRAGDELQLNYQVNV